MPSEKQNKSNVGDRDSQPSGDSCPPGTEWEGTAICELPSASRTYTCYGW